MVVVFHYQIQRLRSLATGILLGFAFNSVPIEKINNATSYLRVSFANINYISGLMHFLCWLRRRCNGANLGASGAYLYGLKPARWILPSQR